MKAAVFTRYGPPDVLELRDVPKPAPREHEVLIRVHASSINEWDWSLLHGRPFINRLLYGLHRPRRQILGADVAGTVEAIGSAVRRFRPGDAVFANLWDAWGGFAEYACASEEVFVPKPTNLTFEQAAAVPQAGVLALHGLRDSGHVGPGQRVLINGAGGGVGTLGVRIAKAAGAEVTAVDRACKLAMLRSIGADHVVDYTREDITRGGRQFDLILDVVGRRSVHDFRRTLRPQGRYVMVGGTSGRLFQALLLWAWCGLTRSGRKVVLTGSKSAQELAELGALAEAGTLVPVIDGCYPIERIGDAFRRYGTGEHNGKIVITVCD